MISCGLYSLICSAGSLLAAVVVVTGMALESKPVTRTGQIIGGLDLILCLLFFFLYVFPV